MTDKAQTEEIARREVTVAQEFLDQATIAVIDTPKLYQAGATILQSIKGYLARLEVSRKSLVKPLNDHVSWINGEFRLPADRAKEAEVIWKHKLGIFHQQEEQKRLAAEAKLRDEAEKERLKKLAQAEKLDEKGKDRQAEAKREEAESIPTPAVIQAEQPKGLSYREVVEIEITDRKLVPFEYWDLNEDKIRRHARAMGGQVEIPGVRIFKTQIVASRKA